MAIPASQIVNVTPRVINAGGNDLEITGLILTKNPLCIVPGTMAFTSKTAVGSYFGLDSAEYLAATKYFLGYDNSFRKPRRLRFARLLTEAAAGSLIGGTAQNLETLKTITDGGLTISIDGTEKSVTGLDFSRANTQSDVAAALQAKLTGTTVTYNSNLGSFIVTSSTTGAASAVSVASGGTAVGGYTPAQALGLTTDTGALVSAGSAELTPSQNMDSIIDQNQNWVSFTTLDAVDDATVVALAEWTNLQNVSYMYCPWTQNPADTLPSNTSNLPNTLIAANLEGTILTFGGVEDALLVLSIGACIDWDRVNGLVTYAFKTQTGLAASVTDETTAENLVAMNCNYYGRWATRNDDFIQYYQGKMIGGNFGYADAYVGNIWLRNALQVAIMNGLNQTGRVPYVERGYAIIRAWCSDPINRALNNGIIDTGVTLSEAQKAELITEIGQDVSSEIFTNGYYLQITDPGAVVRANRESPVMGLWYTYGGSVHKVELPATAVL